MIGYNGEFVKPAQQLLAYTHQMQGKIDFDRLNYAAAAGHFQEMIDLGEALNDAEIIALGMIEQANILRKRERYELAFRRFEAAKPFADASAPSIRGTRFLVLAGAQFLFGNEYQFEQSIHEALAIASQPDESLGGLANHFNLEEVRLCQAAGFTTLGKPEKALEIYKETDQLRAFRPLREQGPYIIDKAQAYLHLGSWKQGMKLAQQGINLASIYRSKRHIARLEKTHSRLRNTPLGRERQLGDLRNLILSVDISTW
jgi:tetratricopeptide (TPR) repeat protein